MVNEAPIRLTVFLTVLAGMMVWELAAPHRRQDLPRLLRWSNTFALVALDAALIRVLFPVAAVGMAVWAQERGLGLFALVDWPVWAEALLAILILDLAIWTQHLVFHAVPWLWRLHRMHHADPCVDAVTGLRFHPAEIVLSMLIKLVVIALLGPPAVAVLLFEVVLNASSLFNHANIRLPARVERLTRLVLVTPDMHRIHHSALRAETDSNYGFTVPWWDRIFGTYRAAPVAGQDGVVTGIGAFASPRDQWLDRLLLQPLRRGKD
ncbi:MAG: sterol desaturase family protein [Pseudomonadota bacterium]